MKRNSSIKFKAALLLLVFSVNTLVGFACSIGLDMGFNSQHHSHGSSTQAAMHSHKKHTHTDRQQSSDSEKKDCCTDEVKQFHDIDKSIPDIKMLVHPVFSTSFYGTDYHFQLLPPVVVKDVKPFVQQEHPPIPNIRVAIRSFQI